MFFKKNLKKVSDFFSDSCKQILNQKMPGFKDEKASYIGSNNTYCQIGIMIKSNKDALNRKIIKQNISFSNMPIKSKKSFCLWRGYTNPCYFTQEWSEEKYWKYTCSTCYCQSCGRIP